MTRPWPTGRPAEAPSGATTRALADLARAGHRVLDEPSMRVEFEIHHGLDRPGDLAATLAGLPDTAAFADTLCSVAHGACVIVGTRVGDDRISPGERRPRLELDETAASRTVFRGSERPNLTFRHESAEPLSGIIAIETEPRKILLRNGLAVLDALRHVAETAVGAGDAPLLTLHCPAQLPPTNALHDEVTGRGEPARSSSMAIRFEMALDHPRADLRFQVADRLARYCESRGLGLWLGDTRPGYRAGNWFSVVAHDHSRARRLFPRAADRGAHTAAEGFVPVTLVGPARAGATHAILSFLAQYPEVGVLSCALTPLNELAFLHLQLAVNAASRPRLAAVTRALDGLRALTGGPEEILRALVPHLLGAEPTTEPGRELVERLVGRAGDYRTAVGPALRVDPDNVVRRLPLWVSWHARHGGGPRLPLVTLQRAIERLDLTDRDLTGAAAAGGISYAVARQLGSTAAGRAKIAVSKNLVERRFPGSPGGPARLCALLQDAWLDELRTAGHDARPGEVSVSAHESWLGRGSTVG